MGGAADGVACELVSRQCEELEVAQVVQHPLYVGNIKKGILILLSRIKIYKINFFLVQLFQRLTRVLINILKILKIILDNYKLI